MSKSYVVTEVSEVAGDGSQDIRVRGRDTPFHVDAEWVKSQGKEVEAGDIMNDEGNRLTVQAAPDGENAPASPSLYRYRANPVEVSAYRITEVAKKANKDGSLAVTLENGDEVVAEEGMLSRITPSVGDYWVVGDDNYIYLYLNPKEVFERKYSAVAQ